MSSDESQLRNRYKNKELRLKPIKNKADLINRVIYILDSTLLDDIKEVLEFRLAFDTTLLLSNTNFYIYYKSSESAEEKEKRLIKEDEERREKLILLSRLAEELNYKLEKNK